MKPMGDLFNLEPKSKPAGPVECLGMIFPNDEERRNHFVGLLREKLKDPGFGKIEGFPIGSDEDSLALSDPPYYTACSNPSRASWWMASSRSGHFRTTPRPGLHPRLVGGALRARQGLCQNRRPPRRLSRGRLPGDPWGDAQTVRGIPGWADQGQRTR